MKNRLYVLSLIPLLLGVTSCNKDDHKVNLLFGRETVTQLENITYGDLASKIEDEANFIIAVTPSGNCTCWNTFKNIMLRYAQKNKLIIYTISNEELRDAKDDKLSTFGIDYRSDRETFLIFEDGKIRQQRVYDSKDSIFKQEDSFVKYIEGQVNLPNYYHITKNELDALYNGEESFNIYFSRSTCPDCNYVEKAPLKEFAKNNPDFRNLYILDCDQYGIRKYDEDNHLINEDEWNTFKKDYGLSNDYNPTFGYNTGYVPTFFSVTPTEDHSKTSSIKMGSVYFNDKLQFENDKYVVIDSYYTKERLPNLSYAQNVEIKSLIDLSIPLEDVDVYGEYFAWKQEKAAKYHDPLLLNYLETLK